MADPLRWRPTVPWHASLAGAERAVAEPVGLRSWQRRASAHLPCSAPRRPCPTLCTLCVCPTNAWPLRPPALQPTPGLCAGCWRFTAMWCCRSTTRGCKQARLPFPSPATKPLCFLPDLSPEVPCMRRAVCLALCHRCRMVSPGPTYSGCKVAWPGSPAFKQLARPCLPPASHPPGVASTPSPGCLQAPPPGCSATPTSQSSRWRPRQTTRRCCSRAASGEADGRARRACRGCRPAMQHHAGRSLV